MRTASIASACVIAIASTAGVVSAAERPNLIAIVTDDQADWTIGAYGNAEVRTPNLDRLARSGARFTRAFTATPVCSPSRVTYLTGLYGTQVGITDYLNRDEEAAGVGIPAWAITWPQVLQQNGYITELIGKWHLGTHAEFHPTRHGFDRFYGWLLTPKWIDPQLEIDGKLTQLRGPPADLMTDEGLRFIEAKRNTPFAPAIHFLAPHAPYGPLPAVDAEPYANRDLTAPEFPGNDPEYVRKELRKYYASIHAIDRNVGRLLDGLDHSNSQDELFDLRGDPEELTNRHNDPATAEVRGERTARLEQWMQSIDDPLLRDPGYDASKKQPLSTEKAP